MGLLGCLFMLEMERQFRRVMISVELEDQNLGRKHGTERRYREMATVVTAARIGQTVELRSGLRS